MSKRSKDSKGRPAALFLTPEAPYPIAGGGPMRSASILEFLASSYEVDVIVFREPGAPDPVGRFRPGLVKNIFVIDLPFHSRELHARALRNLRRFAKGIPPLVDRFSGFDTRIVSALEGRQYRTAILEHFWCAGYGSLVRQHADRVILDLHNIESVLLARCAQAARWPESMMLKRFATSCKRLESQLLQVFFSLLVSSQADADLLSGLLDKSKVIVCPNTIQMVPVPHREKADEIVFSGNLEYHPNISAVSYFHQKIWPLLRERWPDLSWRLLGKNHEEIKQRLIGDSRIRVTGPVDNAIEELASAKLAVAPLLSGSGTRIKIIEAWAACLPVVSTSIGAEGLPGIHGEHLLIADTPVQFADAVSSVLASQELRDRLARNGRKLYEQELTWESAWSTLRHAIIEV
jgi:glycosyltransferase involved in cell wall biosynthesis